MRWVTIPSARTTTLYALFVLILLGVMEVTWGRGVTLGIIAVIVAVGLGVFTERVERPSEVERDGSPQNSRDPIDTLQQRYAAGELTDEEFERRLDRLLESDEKRNRDDTETSRDRISEFE
ncbi:hypothetical protein C453_03274 [Haloferax elongans ATCC BAA-1513]|uniref:SHOCT domain-containing protein n=1 Tax=Haloferax elongans ATCC BAA-1513 TaxID=1230453 RepID=M0HW45_HALEO|nr:SHOCT domain-containing protein [Haloferax elongans]ELZ87339.1 hypothetical protein C453_03274 [Haloferax elongans ATCC BAA-1513]